MDPDSVLLIDAEDQRLQRILHHFLVRTSKQTPLKNITCTVDGLFPESRDIYGLSLGGNNLFGVIFLSACVVLTVALCTIWFMVIYYRRMKQSRMDQKVQEALANAVRQLLDETPMVIFEAKKNEPEDEDDHPLCVICLEAFVDDEQIRKLRKTLGFTLSLSCLAVVFSPSLFPSLSCCLCRSLAVGTSELSTVQSKRSPTYSPLDLCADRGQSNPREKAPVDCDAGDRLNISRIVRYLFSFCQ